MMREGRFYKQGLYFVLVSGIGWLIDFGGYSYLTGMAGWDVCYANFLSAVPAVTFVFFMSTRHIFNQGNRQLSLYKKYILYLLYQILLVASVSLLAQGLYETMLGWECLRKGSFYDLLPIIVKVIITPITVSANFFMMKVLTERL